MTLKSDRITFVGTSPVVLMGFFYLIGAIATLNDPETRIGNFLAQWGADAQLTSFVIGTLALFLGVAMLAFQSYAARGFVYLAAPLLVYQLFTAAILLYTHAGPDIGAVISVFLVFYIWQNIELQSELKVRDELIGELKTAQAEKSNG